MKDKRWPNHGSSAVEFSQTTGEFFDERGIVKSMKMGEKINGEPDQDPDRDLQTLFHQLVDNYWAERQGQNL